MADLLAGLVWYGAIVAAYWLVGHERRRRERRLRSPLDRFDW